MNYPLNKNESLKEFEKELIDQDTEDLGEDFIEEDEGFQEDLTEEELEELEENLEKAAKKYDIYEEMKSHSFRAGFITNLLRSTSVQNTAKIVGHKNILTTMAYNRYSINKEETRNILDITFSEAKKDKNFFQKQIKAIELNANGIPSNTRYSRF
jgi:site-specific recombinase XerD